MSTESAPVPHIGVLTRTREKENRIARLAERQYGVVSRRQLLGLGFSRREIEARIKAGRLNPLQSGVYAVGHRLIPREGKWMAAVLASGPEAVLSHWSAAALWMIRPNSRLREDPVGRRRSRLEERFAPFLRRNRLPLPRFNDWILLGDKRYLVDCHWPDLRQVVELDGWDGHSTRTAFREDRARDRRLAAAGYRVTRITWNQLEDEAETVASDLRSLLLG